MRNPPLWDRMRRQNKPGLLLGGLLLVAGYLTLLKVLINAFHPPIRKVFSGPLLPPSSAAIKTAPLAPSFITVKRLTLPAARPNTLLAKARRVADVATWNLHTQAGIQPYQNYFWAGKGKVFFFAQIIKSPDFYVAMISLPTKKHSIVKSRRCGATMGGTSRISIFRLMDVG